MDMDMDIPDPEELEWLESNTFAYQDDIDFEEEYYPEPLSPREEEEPNPTGDHQTQKRNADIQSHLAKPIEKLENNGNNKRDRPKAQLNKPDLTGPGENEESSKRSRVDGTEDADVDDDNDNDEDWLRYAPPRSETLGEQVAIVEEVKQKILSRFATEIDGDCVPLTGFDGERVYAKICRRGVDEEGKVKRKLEVKCEFKGLISDPIRVLMQRVEHDEFSKALQASAEVQNETLSPEVPMVNEQLWVDKYAPSSFTELLSDEQTNREVLMWLKQWDSCVFGNEIKSTTDDVLSSLRRHSSVVQHSKLSYRSSFGSKKEHRFSKETPKDHNGLGKEDFGSKGTQDLCNNKHIRSGPPEQKILLLCGPPGLGKTTLAHVAARHCGYRVVEINASDDRASSTIEAKILDVVQMNSVTADSKPKCLIIDEIDGALSDGKGAVEVILKMVSTSRKSITGKENVKQDKDAGLKSSKKKRGETSLLRPVICICNDLYAPALRPLRQVAKVHVFVQPTVTRVVNRLKYICNREAVKTSSVALTTLAQYTECDIRSCLNTLQFLNKRKETLNVLEIGSQVVGRKDASKSAFDIWKEIFQKRREKQVRISSYCQSGRSNDFEFLHTLISNRGDYDLILDGVHENILQLRYYDPLMKKTVQCLDGLGVSDVIHKYIMRTQQMFMQVYQSSIAIAIHGLVAQVEKPNIDWPKSFWRYHTTLMDRMDMFSSWHYKISPNISRHLFMRSFVEDSISPLLQILSPQTLRPVALHLLSDKEKSDMDELVDTMVSYSITYKNVKADPLHGNVRQDHSADASMLSYDPPIDRFANFKGFDSSHVFLASAVKQLLVHEVEKQKILQGSTYKSTRPSDACSKDNQALAGRANVAASSSRSNNASSGAERNINCTSNQKKLTPSTLSGAPTTECSGGDSGTLKSHEKLKKPSGGSSSFFDRFKKVSSKGSPNTCALNKASTVEHSLLFKFNEGYTNAVRRPVRMREFLL